MPNIAEVRELTKVFETEGAAVTALDRLSLGIERGAFIAVMGPSGCGKSTLLHLLGGLDRPTSGEILLDGERVDELSETAWARRRRRRIGYVFQFFNLVGNLSAADNIELPALVAGRSTADARASRLALMRELNIEDRANLAPAQLSGGEQQRVAIARALVNDPDLLLADEPTGNLDSSSADEVLELLRHSHERGQTIVMVTHDPRVAAAADRIVHMKDGRIDNSAALNGTS